MKEFCLIQRNHISFLKRTNSFSFTRARTFQSYFGRARTFTRTFDRVFVRGEYNDQKFCRRIFYYYAAGKKIDDEFLIGGVEKNDDEFDISGEEKINEFF